MWGICAGLILLANELDQGAKQPLIGGLDINVKRNAFGRQSKSAFRPLTTSGAASAAGEGAYFIRAPMVTRQGGDVEVLATTAAEDAAGASTDAVVAVRQGNLMGTCFHPEISSDDSWLQLFLKEVTDTHTHQRVPFFARVPHAMRACVRWRAWSWWRPRRDCTSGGEEGVTIVSLACRVFPWPTSTRVHLALLVRVQVCGATTEAAAAVPDYDVAAPWMPTPSDYGYGSEVVKRAFSVFQKGGVIMDVVNGEQVRLQSPRHPPPFAHPLPSFAHPSHIFSCSGAHRRGRGRRGRDGPRAHPRRHQG